MGDASIISRDLNLEPAEVTAFLDRCINQGLAPSGVIADLVRCWSTGGVMVPERRVDTPVEYTGPERRHAPEVTLLESCRQRFEAAAAELDAAD